MHRLFAIVAGVLLGGCSGSPLPMSRSPGNTACGDPCAAMVCPSGNWCTWDTNCRPRCEQKPLPNFSR